MIVSKTPFRISFFGGGSDFPLFYNENGGAVLSTTINKYAYINCRYLPNFFNYKYHLTYSIIERVNHTSEIQHPVFKAVLEKHQLKQGLEVSYNADLPARSGLGSSSAFTAGLLNTLHALQGKMVAKPELLRQTLEIEHKILKENSGSQDQTAAVFGGFNFIQFTKDGEIIPQKVIAPGDNIKQLEDSILLIFTGIQRFAENIEKDKIAQLEKKKSHYVTMHQMAMDAYSLLQSENFSLNEFSDLLNESWRVKQDLSNKVSNDYILEIQKAGLAAGALGTKILGAGGGGFILFLVNPEKRHQIIEKLKPLIHIPVKFEKSGSSIVVYEPDGL
jgi:D-glycero-alpha-D-manno-heptose-7-phosphate kinase